jgi:hypothetical protein
MRKLLYCLIVLYTILPKLYSQTLAFPGADGFGKFASGGRGGRVIEVTNLNDDGFGSLRAALKEKGARTIVFKVSGTIALKSELKVTNGDFTIAGQTAPGDGICLKDNKLQVEAANVIIRYIRFRLGDETRQETDSFGANNSNNLIFDHCSMSWSIDEVGSFYTNKDFTLQWCILSESLHHSYHKKGEHGYGGIWGGLRATFHHNLFAHNSSRNPRFQGARKTGNPNDELADFRNNVIFNWGFNSAYAGEMGRYNMVANYYKAGPASIHKNRIIDPWDDKARWFIKDNYVEGYPEVSADNWAGGVQGDKWVKESRVDTPFTYVIDKTDMPQDAYKKIILDCGATLPVRDIVDTRIIEELKTGKPTYEGKYYRLQYPKIDSSMKCGIIDSQTEVGGWPELKSAVPPIDTDHDGIPDEWEKLHGLNPDDASDGGKITSNGYSNLENYLNELCK